MIKSQYSVKSSKNFRRIQSSFSTHTILLKRKLYFISWVKRVIHRKHPKYAISVLKIQGWLKLIINLWLKCFIGFRVDENFLLALYLVSGWFEMGGWGWNFRAQVGYNTTKCRTLMCLTINSETRYNTLKWVQYTFLYVLFYFDW